MADDDQSQEQEQEVPNGLYVMFLFMDPTKCLDVSGGYDDKGQNIWLWTFYGGAGQIVWVEKQDQGYVFTYPLTGNVIDIAGGVLAAGTNIQQYEFNNTNVQFWDLVDTGEIGVVQGTTLKAYYITSKADSNFVIFSDGRSDGTNVILQDTWYGSDYAKFLFCQYEMLPPGTYKIHPYLSGTGCLGVAGHSSAMGASCVMEAPVDDSNYQIVKVDNYDGVTSIRCVETGYALTAALGPNGTLDNGDDAVWYQWNGSENQQWLLRLWERRKRYGIETPIYSIINRFGSMQKAIDVCGSSTVPKTNIRVWNLINSRNAQYFWFVPAEAYAKDLSVPSDIQGYVDGEYGTVLGVTTTSIIYPAWYGNGESWKVRYRHRSRYGNQGNSTRTNWGNWKSLDFGYETNEGWGEPGIPNADASLGNGVYTATDGVSLAFGATGNVLDLVEIEFEVRQLVAGWGTFEVDAHSGSSSKVITVAYRPTLTINSVKLDHNGATVSYTSNFNRSGNNIDISVSGMFSCSGRNLPRQGTLTTKKLKSIPDDDREVTVSWNITSVDGVTNSGSTIITASVDYSRAPTMNCTTAFDTPSHTLRVTCPSGTSYIRYWLLLQEDTNSVWKSIEVDAYSRVCYIPYPLTKQFKILVVGIVNGAMQVYRRTFSSRNEITRLWNFDDSTGKNHDYCIGTWAMDSLPEETVDTTASNDDRPTTSGTWNRVIVGSVRSQSRSITSVAIDDILPDGRERIRRLSEARYAWYRNPEGDVCRVAIISVNETRRYYGSEFSVEMRRIDEHS